MRKSIVVNRSSFPFGACSRHATSAGRCSGADSSARTAASGTPSRCRRKYSCPLLEDPSRFARHSVKTRGKFAGSSGSSAGEAQPARASSSHDVVGGFGAGGPRLVGELEGVAIERRVRGQPAEPCGQRVAVGECACRPATRAGRGRELVGPEGLVAPLVGGQVPVRRRGLLARRARPVQRERDGGPARDRPDLLLADVVRPAATVDALAAAEQHQREHRAVGLVGMEPVVDAGPHGDHRAAVGLLGVAANSRAMRTQRPASTPVFGSCHAGVPDSEASS